VSRLARRGGPALLAALLALLGAGSGLAAALLHQRWWGLALGLLAGVAVTVAVPAGWSRRVSWAAGWLVAVGLAASRRPEGDYVVPGNAAGYTLLIASLVLAVVAMVTVPSPRKGGPRPADPEETAPRT
jgi:disulfide bond formation protein DsbB